MIVGKLTLTVCFLMCGVLASFAQDAPKIEALLQEIDPWVTTDTTKILSYIDSCNAVTTTAIESSRYWEPAVRDLSFLLGIDLITSPQIDNTGRIYFMMRLTGESSALFYMDGPMQWPIQLSPNNWTEEGFTISGYTVHPSGNYLLVRVNKFGDEMHDVWYFTRDGKFRPLLESRIIRYSGLIFNEDNPDEFYLYIDNRSQMHIARYTISSGKLDTLYTEPGAFYPTDYYQGKIPFVRWFSFSEGQLAMYDINTKKVTDLSDTALFWAASFTKDGKVLALTSDDSKEDEFMKFCLYDPAKPKTYTVAYDPGLETDEMAFNRKTGDLIAILNKDGYSLLGGVNLNGNKLVLPQTDIGIISSATGNDLGDLVFEYSSPSVPPTAFKGKIGETAVTQIGKVSTFGFDFSDMKVEVIRYKSADGMEIPALLYIPPTAQKDGNTPAIIEYHGGPPGQSRPYFQRNMAFAFSRGFIFMRPNVRGSTGYGPAYEQADNLEGRFTALKDAEAAIDYLIDEGWSKPEKIAIWGASYGGYTVNWLGTQCPDKFAVIVSEVGVSDVDHTNRHSSQVFAKGWEKEYGPVGSDLTRKLSPIFYAENLKAPILVTGGYNDPRVPPSDPRRFAYVLSKLGKPVYYYEETEQGHGSSFKAQLIHDLASNYVFTMMHVMD
ncbi:MAG: S9 family peptidase [candidate division Zixibacteria bacterium]|nr:S9 family peptidase [candidate division Zixibacteria bacterium]